MFCFKCGTEIPDESDFCMKCGAKIPQNDKIEIEQDNSISTIPMNTTIKSSFVSTIVVSETEISYKSCLKSETIKISDISDIRYTAGTPSENGRLFITANGKSYNVMFFFNNNKKIAELCSYFSTLTNNTFIPMDAPSITSQTRETQPKEKTLSKRQRIKQNKKNGIACCPKCGSASLSANKQGYGIGKGLIGAKLLDDSIGFVVGNINSKKVHVTCLNCGHKWKI